MSGDSRASGILAQEVSSRGYKIRIPASAVCEENLPFRHTRFPPCSALTLKPLRRTKDPSVRMIGPPLADSA